GPMGEVNLSAVGIDRLAVDEAYAGSLVEALMRRVLDEVAQKRDFHAAPMRDEVDERLREELPALAHVVKNRGVVRHRVEEVRKTEEPVRGHPEAVVEEQRVGKKGVFRSPFVIDIFEARRGHDELALSRLQPSEYRREVAKQDHVDVDIGDLVEIERERLQLTQAPAVRVEDAGIKLLGETIDLDGLFLDEMRPIDFCGATGARDVVVVGNEIERQRR